MAWEVELHDAFVPEFEAMDEAVQDELLAHVEVLDGVWHFAFAFDPQRNGIVLCGGDKSGGSEKRFYRQLVAKADDRFDSHLMALRQSDMERGRSSKRKSRP